MQAIVKEKRAPGLKVTTVAKPSAGPGEVLIAVRHAGVCGTDLHIADWDPWAQGRLKPPLVIGHEFAGASRWRTTGSIGGVGPGSCAEYIAMPATNVLPLDGSATTVGAVMDPMGNAFHTVLTADVSGSSVFIVGCGPIGCFAVGIARAAGAAKVIASDVNPKRLELARTMGAHVIINAARDDVVRTVVEETGGEGADVVCEVS